MVKYLLRVQVARVRFPPKPPFLIEGIGADRTRDRGNSQSGEDSMAGYSMGRRQKSRDDSEDRD